MHPPYPPVDPSLPLGDGRWDWLHTEMGICLQTCKIICGIVCCIVQTNPINGICILWLQKLLLGPRINVGSIDNVQHKVDNKFVILIEQNS